MSKIKEISRACIKRWGEEDENIKNFSNKVGKFISQLECDEETGEILLELLREYNYYSKKRIDDILRGFYKKLEEFDLPKSRTIYSRIEKGPKINSSNNLLEEFKILNKIGNNYSYDITKMDIGQLKYVNNIIFLDDIIGSGNTIIRFLKENENKIKNKNIIICCIEIMKEAKENIEEYLKLIKCDSVIISYKQTEKAFSSKGIFNKDAKNKKKILVKFEEERLKANDYVLGYKGSEALTTFYRNTPNNTISSYWIDKKNWKPLFPRDLDKPDFMKKQKKKDNVKYNLSKIIKEKGIDVECITI